MITIEEHLEKLHAFKTVADSGSFRGAAILLKRTQPSLTRAVQILEEAAGVALFERSVRGVSLSAEGQILYLLSERLHNEVEAAKGALRRVSGDKARRLTVGCYESIASDVWPDFYVTLTRSRPEIVATLRSEGDLWRLLEWVQQKKIQLAIGNAVEPDDRIAALPLYSDEFHFYCTNSLAQRYSFDPKVTMKLVTLNAMPLLTVSEANCGDGLTLSRLLLQAGVKAQQTSDLDTFSLALRFAVKDLGIAILPSRIAAEALQAKNLVRLRVEGVPAKHFGIHTLWAYWLKGGEEQAFVKNIADELRRFTNA